MGATTVLEEIINTRAGKKHAGLASDAQKILDEFKISYLRTGINPGLQNNSTIIASNHYIRPFLTRKNIFTTYESLFSSCIISIEIAKITKRKLTWVVKNNLKESLGPVSVDIRDFQKKIINVYNFIGVGENYPFGEKQKWLNYLNSGYNIACYPEAKVSTRLIQAKTGLTRIVNFLKVNNIHVNILPVAIYWEDSKYILSMGKIVQTKHRVNDFETITMRRIAEMLPPKLRGYYR